MPDTSGRYVMAIDVGLTNVKAALVARDGSIHHNIVRPAPIGQGAVGVASILVPTCRETLAAGGLAVRDLVAVGCCAPGCVDPETGVVVASASAGWVGVETRAPLEKSFGRSVTVEGKGGATALAYHTFGPTKGRDHLLGINIGTGIFAGYMVHGKLLRGAGQAALEVGHMPLFHLGRRCTCGQQGCWQAYAGGDALRRVLREYQLVGHRLPSLPEELAELAFTHDINATSIWEEQGKILGLGIAMLLNILNPKAVVLGGGMIKAWSLLKKSLLKTAREKALPRNSEAAIVCGPNPEQASLLGAAVCAIRTQGPLDFFVDPTSRPA